MSHLRDSASWIWPGGMCWHRSLAALAVKAGETQEGVPKATAQDADIRSWRLLAGEPGERRRKRTRRQRWTNRR
jgi:hypothetical protein